MANSTIDLGDLSAEQIIRHHDNVLGEEFATLSSATQVRFE